MKPDRLAWTKDIEGAIDGPAPKKHKAGKVTIKEKDLQQGAEDLCERIGLRFFRIPDKLLAWLAWSAPLWTRIFVSRYLAGVPDMMLFKRSPDGYNKTCFIEIKTEAGKISQGQAKWHFGLNVKVTYGWDETKKAIMDFHNDLPMAA